MRVILPGESTRLLTPDPPCSAVEWLARLEPRELTYLLGAAAATLARLRGCTQEQLHRELAAIASAQPQ